jgi:hypothetical protein
VKAWKFAIDYLNNMDEFSPEEVRSMVAETAGEADGRVVLRRDAIYMTKFSDAFSFRLRAGHLVSDAQGADI